MRVSYYGLNKIIINCSFYTRNDLITFFYFKGRAQGIRAI